MKVSASNVATFALAVLALALSGPSALADIRVRLSVKFIKNYDGTRPSFNPSATFGSAATPGVPINTSGSFAAEVTRGNNVRAVTARGFKLAVVEYIDIEPVAPAGQPANYWYTLDARSNVRTAENAAIADPTTWAWNPNAINVYVNNRSSGQCSFVGQGGTITLGGTVGPGTVLHETG